jgi:hypothetical protein
LLLLLTGEIFAQNQMNKEIPLLIPKDKSFITLLDSANFIIEKQRIACDTLMFHLSLYKKNECISISIFYFDYISDVFYIPQGYFIYKNVLIFIDGNSVKKMFKKTRVSRTFQFFDYTSSIPYIYDPKTWNYLNCNGRFNFISIDEY